MSQHTLLVVEDDLTTREALSRIFRLKGYQVRTASTVEEGLRLLDPPPDFVILDLMLPDEGGEVLLTKIRADRMPTRVAVCTGLNDSVRMAALAGLKPDGILQKPVELSAISRALGLPA